MLFALALIIIVVALGEKVKLEFPEMIKSVSFPLPSVLLTCNQLVLVSETVQLVLEVINKVSDAPLELPNETVVLFTFKVTCVGCTGLFLLQENNNRSGSTQFRGAKSFKGQLI